MIKTIKAPRIMSDGSEKSALPVKKLFIDLPLEIISYIFKFLTVSDIQEARLVCIDWYMASQAPDLLEREKVVSSREYGCPSPDLLLKCNRQFLNISLMGNQDTAWYSKDFWSQFGPTLRSLSFHYSDVKENQLLSILCHCPRLRNLEINECECLFSYTNHQLIAENQTENITPELFHLQHLKIANIYDPSCDLFNKLVDCAPNLTSLSLDDCMAIISPKVGPQALTFKHVVSYLREKPHCINALHLTCCGDEDNDFFTAVTLPNLHLCRLQTDYSNVSALFTTQRWLQDIELTCNASDFLLETICLNLPHLKHLSLLYCSLLTKSGIIMLPNLKKLTSLSLLQCCKVSGEAFLQALCQNSVNTLTKLAMTELGLVSHLHIVALAKAHPFLTHLDLSYCVGVTDWSVQAIFRYQTSLQSLTLVQCRNLSDAGLSGAKIHHCKYIEGIDSMVCKRLKALECGDKEGYLNPTGCGISKLKNLQKLNLNGCNINGTSFIYGLKLPAIRHLVLDNNMISEEAFKSLFYFNRTIETLELSNCYGVQNSLIPVIVEKLKRLKSIDIEDCQGVTIESISILRQHCRKVKD